MPCRQPGTGSALRVTGPAMESRIFPERNKTMSALGEATITVEAGESSGTLMPAQAALWQSRSLFIRDNCFRNPRLNWQERLRTKGAI